MQRRRGLGAPPPGPLRAPGSEHCPRDSEPQRLEKARRQGALRTRPLPALEQAPPFKIQIHILRAWKRGLAEQIALVRPGLLERPRVNRGEGGCT